MLANGYERDFAERTFKQIEGFGSYGFPESHAASFAKIAYASCWMKHHHPEIFCAALLNAQPMGFYAPAQIVRDAREHGVEVRPVCVNASRWDCTLGRQRPDGQLSPAPPRPPHGEGPLQRPWRADRGGGDGCALRLGRGCLAPLRRAGGGAREAGRCRRLPFARPRPAPGAVAGAGPRRRAAAAVRRRRGARRSSRRWR